VPKITTLQHKNSLSADRSGKNYKFCSKYQRNYALSHWS